MSLSWIHESIEGNYKFLDSCCQEIDICTGLRVLDVSDIFKNGIFTDIPI